MLHNSLVRQSDSRTCLALVMALGLGAALLVGCGTSGPDAKALLRDAQAHYASTSSFQFIYSIDPEGAPLSQATTLYVKHAQGAVQQPGRLSATVDALVPSGQILGARAIVIEGQGWLQDTPASHYSASADLLVFTKLLDAQSGLSSLLTTITDVHEGPDSHGIVAIAGTIDAGKLSGIFPGLPEQAGPVHLTADVNTSTHQLVGMVLGGIFYPEETTPRSHIFAFSHLDEPVDIEPPSASA
ncbi:MAG TPA: LppX_LprAFG lipoprotein [Ktedonobacterales bacterium]